MRGMGDDDVDNSAGAYRIVVRSIGTAGAHVISVLDKVSRYSRPQLAALLYRAPSELVSGLDREVAQAVVAELGKLGLDCIALGPDEDFIAGAPKFELALITREPKRMSELAARVAFLLGVKPEQAIAIVCQAPALLLGQVSDATVEAFQNQFAALGVELVSSELASARYDLILAGGPGDRERVCRHLADIPGLTIADRPASSARKSTPTTSPSSGSVTRESSVIAEDLPSKCAQEVWSKIARSGLPVRLVNRAFERVDIALERAPSTSAVHRYLMDETGMPERVARTITNRLSTSSRNHEPVIIFQQLSLTQAKQKLASLKTLRCRARGLRHSLQRHQLRIHSTIKSARAQAVICSIINDTSLKTGLKNLAGESIIDAPLTLAQARWIACELRELGIRSSILSA